MKVNATTNLQAIASAFIQSFETGDYDKMRSFLAENLQSYITNAQGGVNLLDGRDAFMENVMALDVKGVKPKAKITQITTIKPNQVMLMIEINAERKGKKLHNFAAYLLDFKDDLISRLHMVEALPAYSDGFWKH